MDYFTIDDAVDLVKRDIDVTDETDWSNQHAWMASKLEIFNEVFRSRIKTLHAEDWVPDDTDNDE